MGIYVNRILNLKKIKAIGLDMDYTLVRYYTENFERETYLMARERLVTRRGYPRDILDIDFDFKRAIRGLVIDEKMGNLLKISLYGRIKKAYHGTRLIESKALKEIYHGQIVDPGEKFFTPIDSCFSISHGVLFSHLVDLRDKTPKAYPAYEEIAQDVLQMIDHIHRDGSLKSYVTEQMHKFFIQDKKTPLALEKLKQSGKKLFIVTNSDYSYTQKLLDYTLNPFLKDHSDWRELFDIIVTLAAKPRFFTASQRFLKIDQETGRLINIEEKLEAGIFQGGNSIDLQKYLNLESDEILYLGDHIYGDILALKKQIRWRTALIVEEIDQEVETLEKGRSTVSLLNQLMEEKEKYEDEIDCIIDRGGSRAETAPLFNQIKNIDTKLAEVIVAYHASFNPYWGEVMRAGVEESRFAGQVAKYACIYMAKVSDLADISPRKYFRSERRFLPHDPS